MSPGWLVAPLFFVAIPTLARADAISPPPEDCPRGAVGQSSHSGTWCQPTTCESDATCQARYERASSEVRTFVCAPAGLCVRDEEYEPGGLRDEREPRVRARRTVALSPCSSPSDCAADARCETLSRCVQPSLPELVARQSGCSCAVAPRAPLPRGGTLPFLLALLVAWRAQLGGWGRRAPRTRA